MLTFIVGLIVVLFWVVVAAVPLSAYVFFVTPVIYRLSDGWETFDSLQDAREEMDGTDWMCLGFIAVLLLVLVTLLVGVTYSVGDATLQRIALERLDK